MRRLILFSAMGFFLVMAREGRATACFAPAGDWITGADLAAAAPALSGLPPSLKVSYAPIPGIQRVFHPDELRRLALAHALHDPHLTANLCAAWPLVPLTPQGLKRAMEKALAGHSPMIELVARSQAAVPEGEIVFPLAGLSGYSENPAIWKGYVLYAGTRRFDTWATVRLRVQEIHLKAQGVIHAGDRLAPGQWRAESYAGPPLRQRILSDGAEIAGLVARREFADGAPLLAVFFEPPKAVELGDAVTVLAGDGAAHIEAQGVALKAGMCGEVVTIRNPRSNRVFKARIVSVGRVEVLPGASAGLAGSEAASGHPL